MKKSLIVDEKTESKGNNIQKYWKLIDKDTLFIERYLGDDAYEYYRGVSNAQRQNWYVAHIIVFTGSIPEDSSDSLSAALRSDMAQRRCDQLIQEFSQGQSCIAKKPLDHAACMNQIINLSGICGDDKFLRFMILAHEYETESLRYIYIDDPGSGAFFVHNDARVAVISKDKNIAVGVTSGDDLLEKFDDVRVCSACGAPMQSGYTDESNYWCREEEFFAAMDQAYGRDNWRPAPDDSEASYEYKDERGEWQTEPSCWTEWHEESIAPTKDRNRGQKEESSQAFDSGMRPTGEIRRIDDLGRIVISKKIRDDLGINENDPFEVFVSRDGIFLKKYR